MASSPANYLDRERYAMIFLSVVKNVKNGGNKILCAVTQLIAICSVFVCLWFSLEILSSNFIVVMTNRVPSKYALYHWLVLFIYTSSLLKRAEQ